MACTTNFLHMASHIWVGPLVYTPWRGGKLKTSSDVTDTTAIAKETGFPNRPPACILFSPLRLLFTCHKGFDRMRLLSPSVLALSVVLALVTKGPSWGHEGTRYWAQYTVDRKGTTRLLQMGPWPQWASSVKERLQEVSYPRVIAEEQPISPDKIVELYGPTREEVVGALRSRGVALLLEESRVPHGQDEVVKLLETGPSANRIDLVIMGDGYTTTEREKFLADARRILAELFEAPTYRSFKPLFNVYAVYRASAESGIGRDRAKNTAYQLYRDGNTLRAIFCGNPPAAHESSQAAPGCEYPVIIANDPHYGGLGGEFAISTSSRTSGSMVLRHELGHNFGRVGEEYDGGGYFGANHSRSLNTLSWKHWLSRPAREEPIRARFLGWPWHHLSDGTYTAEFDSDGTQAHTYLNLSMSGFATPGEIAVSLDGQPLEVTSPGHQDRAFHHLFVNRGLSAGHHVLKFEEKVHDGDNWVANLTVHECAADCVFDEEAIGAYPVFSRSLKVEGYRPSWETCLMRKMESVRYCAVCEENIWLKFLDQITLIDGVDVQMEGALAKVAVRVPALGQFRTTPVAGETLHLAWYRGGQRLTQFDDQLRITVSTHGAATDWRVEATLVTPEVRQDSGGKLHSEKTFSLTKVDQLP